MIAGMGLSAAWLGAMAHGADSRPLTIGGLGLRSSARRRKRSLATIGLLACGAFLIAAVGAFRLDASGKKLEIAKKFVEFASTQQAAQDLLIQGNTALGVPVIAASAPALEKALPADRNLAAFSTALKIGVVGEYGLATGRVGTLPFELIRASVKRVVAVDDFAIGEAVLLLLERMKLLAEGAGAAALAGAFKLKPQLHERRVVILISGGNIDPNLLGKVLQQGLASAGRYLAFRTWLDDRPGQLHELTGILGDEHINILHVGIHRVGPYTALGRVGLDVIVDTRDAAHAQEVLALVRRSGFPAEQLIDLQPER